MVNESISDGVVRAPTLLAALVLPHLDTAIADKSRLPETSEWLRVDTRGAIGVDRELNIIRGFVVAQEGPFKSERGEFDVKSLRQIVKLMKADRAGLKSRFTHPSLSDDGLGKFLGRGKNPQFVTLQNGLAAVRADLHLSPTSFDTPSGNLGKYVLDLAESDPDALSSSLVLQVDEEVRLDRKGKPLLDDNGEMLPPLWRPTDIHAIDVVDTGDAVDGFLSAQLSADGLPDDVVRQACGLLSKQFAGCSREVVQARVEKWLGRYLDMQFGGEPEIDFDEFGGFLLPKGGVPPLAEPDKGSVAASDVFEATITGPAISHTVIDTATLSRRNRLRKIRQTSLDKLGVH